MTFVCDCCYKTCAGKPTNGYHGTQQIRNCRGYVIGLEDVDIDICEECSKPSEPYRVESDPYLGLTD